MAQLGVARGDLVDHHSESCLRLRRVDDRRQDSPILAAVLDVADGSVVGPVHGEIKNLRTYGTTHRPVDV